MTDLTQRKLGMAGRVREFFFPEASTARLAVMRIVVVLLELTWLMKPLGDHMTLLRAPGFDQPQMLTQFVLLFVDESVYRQPALIGLMYAITRTAGVLALVGLFTRTSMLTFSVGTMLLVSHGYSYGEFHHPQAIFSMFLFLLALSPCGDCLSLDALIHRHRRAELRDARPWYRSSFSRFAMWPIVTVQVLLGVAYFDAGLSKVLVGGVSWFNGYTLQNYLLADGIRWDRPLGVWLSNYRYLCVMMAVGAVGLELMFWLTAVPRLRRLVPVFLLAGVGMHMSIYVLQAAPFFHFMILYLVWMPWEQLPGLRVVASEKTEVEPVVVGAMGSASVLEEPGPGSVFIE